MMSDFGRHFARLAAIRVALLLLLVLSIAATVASGQAQASSEKQSQMLQSASSLEHVWFVANDPREPKELRLYHHAVEMDGPFFRMPVQLPNEPVAMAADGSQVWLIMESLDRRECFSLRALLNPTGLFQYEPPRSLSLHPPLPPTGRLVDFVAGPRGPAALLMPPQWKSADVTGSSNSRAARPALDAPLLIELINDTWQPIELPSLNDLLPMKLIIGPDDHFQLLCYTDQQQLVLLSRNKDVSWSRPSVLRSNVARDAVVGVVMVEDRRILMLMDRNDGETIELATLRSDELLSFATLDRPRNRFTIAGQRSDLKLIVESDEHQLSIAAIDARTGKLASAELMTGQKLGTGSRLLLPAFMAVLTVALLVAILIKPAPIMPITLPEGLRPADLFARAIALLIDGIPACIMAVWITGSDFRSLTNFPLWASSPEESVPVIVAAIFTVIPAMLGELFTQRSLGKALTGLLVVDVSGERPRMWQILLRNLLKLVTLTIPPIAIFVFLSPTRQRLGDTVARTLVATNRPIPPSNSLDRE